MLNSTPFSTPLEKILYLCSTKRKQEKVNSYGKD